VTEPDDSLVVHLVSRNILLSPHNDDAELFAAFTLQRHRPRVIVVLRSVIQERYGISAAEREAETAAALYELGCPYEQWPYPDNDPDWAAIAERIGRLANTYERCFAPAVEPNGHEHHSKVGELALRVFGPERTTRYLTYQRGSGKSSSGCEVSPAVPEHLAGKLRALSCYRTQMRPETGCDPWFIGDLREYVEC
jgi:LmbE family N-acetylglucosaminyl deacetylase